LLRPVLYLRAFEGFEEWIADAVELKEPSVLKDSRGHKLVPPLTYQHKATPDAQTRTTGGSTHRELTSLENPRMGGSGSVKLARCQCKLMASGESLRRCVV
jgi:hypothetical protein